MTLFNTEKMAKNFTELKDIFPTKVMSPSYSPFTFKKEIQSNAIYFDLKKLGITPIEFLEKTNTSGFAIIKNDTIIYEYFANDFNTETHHISWSVSKSVISFLIGKAIEEGYINSIDELVSDYVPQLAKSPYYNVSIKDILQMSSGVRFDEDYSKFSSDINKLGRVFALGTSFESYINGMKNELEPGTFNRYVSMDTQVLGMILREATNQSITDYCEEKLWQPMGAENKAYWIIDNKNMEGVFGGLNATIYDYARIGMVYCGYGKFNGHNLIDSTWINESWTITEPHLMPGENDLSNSIFGYGYQWWIPEWPAIMYQAQGIYSQYIVTVPSKNIVIVKLSANKYFKTEKLTTQVEHNHFFSLLIRHLN